MYKSRFPRQAYQGEVDQLTRRSRFSEGAFMALYKSLYVFKGMKCLCILINEPTWTTTTECLLLTHLHIPHTPGMRHPTRSLC